MNKLLVLGLLPALLSSCGKISQRVLPDQSYAVYLLTQADALKSVQLDMVETPQEGNLLLSVVAATPDAQGHPIPGDSVLVAPVSFPHAKLQSSGSGPLDLPLGSKAWRVPPQGAFLVVQCSPTLATDKQVAITVANRGTSDPTTKVVLRTASNQDKVLDASTYPALAAAQLPATPTYVRLHPSAHWLTQAQFLSLRVETTPSTK
jgi:hypothetical protein